MSEAGWCNFFPALHAVPVFLVFEALERRGQAKALRLSPALRGLCHCLSLQSVHAAEATDRRLVKLNCTLICAAQIVFCIERGLKGEQPVFDLLRCHNTARLNL